MKITGRTLTTVALVGMLLSTGIVLAEDETPAGPSTEQLQKLYVDHLAKEGYVPEVDGDGDVVFKRESHVYFIEVDAKDPHYFTVVLPNIWKIESDAERAKVLAAADAANRKTKVAKVYTTRDNVWVTAEMFVASPGDHMAVFPRLLRALDGATRNFVAKMQE